MHCSAVIKILLWTLFSAQMQNIASYKPTRNQYKKGYKKELISEKSFIEPDPYHG